MSVLSDRDIRASIEAGKIGIRPFDVDDVQPSSVDLHLDRSFRVFRIGTPTSTFGSRSRT